MKKRNSSRHLTDFLADVVVRDDDAAVTEDELTSPTDGGGQQVRRPHNGNVLLADTVTRINVRQQTCVTVCVLNITIQTCIRHMHLVCNIDIGCRLKTLT